MVSVVQTNISIIFNSYDHTIPPSAWTQERSSRDMSVFRSLLTFQPADPNQSDKRDSTLKADTYPPLIYPGLVKHKSTAFRHPALIKVRYFRIHLHINYNIPSFSDCAHYPFWKYKCVKPRHNLLRQQWFQLGTAK